MTDAKITDINEFKARKNAQFFTKWTDDRLQKRHRILTHIEDGHEEFTTGPLAEMSFAGGFDPEKPEQNLGMVEAELVRRGVIVTSQ